MIRERINAGTFGPRSFLLQDLSQVLRYFVRLKVIFMINFITLFRRVVMQAMVASMEAAANP